MNPKPFRVVGPLAPSGRPAKTRTSARAIRDRLDSQWGASRHYVVNTEVPTEVIL